MRPEVRAEFLGFTDQFESNLGYLYTDIFGLVTTGRGNLVDPGLRRRKAGDGYGAPTSIRALGLPWKYPEDGRPATAKEVDTAWWIVKRAWPGVQSKACASLTVIRLDQGAVDALSFQVLDEMWAATLRRFEEAEEWPAPAQKATLSMAWAMGEAFEQGFPRFTAAARAQDWKRCSLECKMDETGNPGLIPRNFANKKLFEEAAAAEVTSPETPIAKASEPPTDPSS
jgi:GH24 family phage-related lysozyme (muramidase)